MSRLPLAVSIIAGLLCSACASQGLVTTNQEAIQKLRLEIADLQAIAQQAAIAHREVHSLQERVAVLEGHLLELAEFGMSPTHNASGHGVVLLATVPRA